MHLHSISSQLLLFLTSNAPRLLIVVDQTIYHSTLLACCITVMTERGNKMRSTRLTYVIKRLTAI